MFVLEYCRCVFFPFLQPFIKMFGSLVYLYNNNVDVDVIPTDNIEYCQDSLTDLFWPSWESCLKEMLFHIWIALQSFHSQDLYHMCLSFLFIALVFVSHIGILQAIDFIPSKELMIGGNQLMRKPSHSQWNKRSSIPCHDPAIIRFVETRMFKAGWYGYMELNMIRLPRFLWLYPFHHSSQTTVSNRPLIPRTTMYILQL